LFYICGWYALGHRNVIHDKRVPLSQRPKNHLFFS
jgi:hypothetical protein